MFKSLMQKPMDWAKAMWDKSFTTAWGKAQMGVAAVMAGLSNLYPWISSSTFQSYMDKFHVPNSVSVGLGVLGMITWFAHGREND